MRFSPKNIVKIGENLFYCIILGDTIQILLTKIALGIILMPFLFLYKFNNVFLFVCR